ncbi:MAG: GntR family transcriptional regulator [Acidobacteria bacterium]|nr:GntR family transcriptional regulator [Acidobacteriota bacterium]
MAKRPKASSSNITQTEKAYNALKHGILRGEIREGVFLSEPDIMKRYGFGRTPFREACNRLHLEGLLEVVPRRGYLVPELSFRAVRDLFEARLVLEGTIAELAAARATDADIFELDHLAKLSARKPGPDPHEIIEINTQFHLCLARATQNRELVRILTGILDQTERLMYIELRSLRFQPSEALGLHTPIVNAIRNRDAAAAREALLHDITDAQSATFGRTPVIVDRDGSSSEERGRPGDSPRPAVRTRLSATTG